MKKLKRLTVVFILLSCFLMPTVKASDDGFYPVNDEASFDKCLENERTCRLTTNLDVHTAKIVKNELVLDLNGKTISADSTLNLNSGLITVARGGTLTINDSGKTGKITTGNNKNVWAAIQLLKDNMGDEKAILKINGGTIEGYYYGIVGNGTRHNTKVTINNGNINCLNKEDCVAIFQPQEGELIINNGTITGGTGIEIRSGKLTINNGTIKGEATKFVKMSNKSGTTTSGVGVAIAQHTTKKNIDVKISGGDISGKYAFYEWNAEKNKKEDINKISLAILGGNFTSFDNNPSVYSEDFTNFISGGKFNTSVQEYLTNDANVVAKIIEPNIEQERQNIIWLLPIFLVIVGTVFFLKYQKQFKIIKI